MRLFENFTGVHCRGPVTKILTTKFLFHFPPPPSLNICNMHFIESDCNLHCNALVDIEWKAKQYKTRKSKDIQSRNSSPSISTIHILNTYAAVLAYFDATKVICNICYIITLHIRVCNVWLEKWIWLLCKFMVDKKHHTI